MIVLCDCQGSCSANEDAALEAQKMIEESDRTFSTEEKKRSKEVFEHFQEKCEKENAQERRTKQLLQWKRRIPHIIEVAACIVIMLGIATPLAIANVESIRSRVLQLLISIQEDHTDLSLIEVTEASFEVPASWRGDYYPSYIPEGYQVYEISAAYRSVVYDNQNDELLSFEECGINDEVSIDTEDAILSYIQLRGDEAFIIEKNGCKVIWKYEDRYSIVSTVLEKSEAIKIAESVRKISK